MIRLLSALAVVVGTVGQPSCGGPSGVDLTPRHGRRVPPPPAPPAPPAPGRPRG